MSTFKLSRNRHFPIGKTGKVSVGNGTLYTSLTSPTDNTASSWWKDKSLRWCMFNLVLLYGAVFSNGYDQSVIGSLQANQSWIAYFDNPTGVKLGLITTAYLFPNLIFPLAASYLADKVGRKPVIMIASLCGIVGPLLSACGNSLGTFVAGRVITGISCAFFQTTAPPLIAELAHPRFRARVAATYLCTFFIAAFICSWVGFGMVEWGNKNSWRVLVGLQCLACLPLVCFTATPWMAESPRFLVKKGKGSQALKLLADLHGNGDQQDALVLHEYQEIVGAVALDAAGQDASYSDFFKTVGNRKRLYIVIWFSWALSMSGNSLFAYYLPKTLELTGISSFVDIQLISGGITLWLCIAGLVSAQFVEKLGRRKLLLYSMVGLVISFALITGLSASFARTGNPSTGNANIFAIFLGLGFYVMGMVPLPYLYLPETLSYNLRVKGMALYTMLAAIWQVYGGLVNPIALDALGWKYYCIFLCTDVIQTVVAYFVIIETKGLTLEDIALLFDKGDGLST
ncbi:general substrate transporter [Naematelia encephala]|uniref:General substrate transporter n=1 Tax=Naematelia encephala TaxID=71784 RepID=A0A1Y2APP3_9TREE|nr:general substrate transporter [Naematelia encephala]